VTGFAQARESRIAAGATSATLIPFRTSSVPNEGLFRPRENCMDKLSQAQIDAALNRLPAWAQAGEAIQRTFQFKNFVEAMRFVDQVALAAERAQHHPDILIRYKKVTLTFATHDANGITDKDFSAAQHADGIAQTMLGASDKPRAVKPAPTKTAVKAPSKPVK
jgi:4a-hydroxytetrahydrobiopterin dehydratase